MNVASLANLAKGTRGERRTPKEWISLVSAASLLDTSVQTVKKLVDQKLISIRQLPGCHAKVSRTDLLALAENCTRQAEASVADEAINAPSGSE